MQHNGRYSSATSQLKLSRYSKEHKNQKACNADCLSLKMESYPFRVKITAFLLRRA